MVISVQSSTVMTLYCFSCSNTVELDHGPHLQTNASVQLCPSNFQLWPWYVRLWRKNRKVLPSLFMIKSTKQISNILDTSQVRLRNECVYLLHGPTYIGVDIFTACKSTIGQHESNILTTW
ncbi:hypothetical protein EJ05DRAFT_384390 [Pseudovirgaria hyperparasitica]|uniref:Uncharacterized protein n=1 Tax=Pseudovirgaria hyperparasitica TaxID=470096 RepID=A0A6A6VS30_9PEZI|nr:uncharacterized protein EJ05DRAFT_384390 [Pseudovirgaria hyperparasitica]KAF2752390.1 hypothetical protein EJ05DRAFT_384390 [Pseudovirgaria hyperparasitica]